MINRRNYVRYIMEVKVSVKSEGDASKTMVGEVLDLSSIGWGAIFKESIAINTIIQFDLTSNFLDEHLEGKAKIVHVSQQRESGGKGFRIGVEFIQADKGIVSRFISEKQRIARQEQIRVLEAERKKQQSQGSDIGPF